MRNRRRPDPRLIRKRRTPHPPHKRRQHPASHRRPRLKCLTDDPPERRPEIPRIHRQHRQTTRNVSHTHHRHQLVRHLRNPLDPANDHQSRHHRHDRTEHPLVLRKHTLTPTSHRHQLRRRLIHLKNIPAPERRKNTEDRKEKRQHLPQPSHPSFRQSLPQIIHRPAAHPTVRQNLTVLHPQRALRKLRRHPKKPTQKQPERHARPALLDPNRYPRNVPQPHRPGHRRTQCLKMRHLTRIICIAVLPTHRPQRQPKRPDVHKLKRKRQNHPSRRQPQHHRQHFIPVDLHREKHRVHKPARVIPEKFVDLLVKPHRLRRRRHRLRRDLVHHLLRRSLLPETRQQAHTKHNRSKDSGQKIHDSVRKCQGVRTGTAAPSSRN